MHKITSLQNPRIKEAAALRERRERDRAGLFLIEGYRELRRALDAGRKVECLFTCPEFFRGTNESNLIERAGCEVIECTREVFAKISYRDRPDGLLAVAPQLHVSLTDLEKILPPNPLLLVAESIEKPGNLGTILRSADAAGVHGVIVADPTTDIHNPNVVRSSVGTLFALPVIEADGEETLAFLRRRQIALVAATPHAKLEFTQADLKGSIAIVVGTEQYGLTDAWMKGADIQVRIPMMGVADSLNVASAATLLLYEALRQRRE